MTALHKMLLRFALRSVRSALRNLEPVPLTEEKDMAVRALNQAEIYLEGMI